MAISKLRLSIKQISRFLFMKTKKKRRFSTAGQWEVTSVGKLNQIAPVVKYSSQYAQSVCDGTYLSRK